MDERIFHQMLGQLDKSHADVEQNAFHALNQQDKTQALICEGVERVTKFALGMEGIDYTASKLLEDINALSGDGTKAEFDSLFGELSGFLDVINSQQEAVTEICLILQDFLENQGRTSEILHVLEKSIAEHRERLDDLAGGRNL